MNHVPVRTTGAVVIFTAVEEGAVAAVGEADPGEVDREDINHSALRRMSPV